MKATLWLFVLSGIVTCSIVIETDMGIWEGRESELSFGFDGIPYAKPPIGPRRWKKPESNEELFTRDLKGNFTVPGPACIQEVSIISKQFAYGYSEDCLTLNVEVPKSIYNEETKSFSGSKVPVMVFIHGGGFTIGMGKEFYVSEEEFIKREVIFVSINYRLSIFGFFTAKELREEDPLAFNFGLQDQRMALQWIKKNIHHLGGDNKRITIFGESAGAMSILWQLSANEEDIKDEEPSLQDIYGAIIQSPADVPILPCTDVDQILFQVLKNLVTDTDNMVEELRRIPPQELLNALPSFPETRKLMFHTITPGTAYIFPCTGDKLFRESYRDVFASGKGNLHPNIIIGTTQHEGTLFTLLTFMALDNTDEESFRRMVHEAFPQADAQAIVEEYVAKGMAPPEMFAEFMTDAYFKVGVFNLCNQMSKRQKNLYRYVFSHISEGGPKHLKAFHASELPYMFHLAGGGLAPESFSEEEEVLSHTMIDYWVNLATHGTPESEGLPAWPRYSTEEQYTQDLKVPIETLSSHHHETSFFWNQLYPKGLPWMGECNEMIHESWSSWFVNKLFYFGLMKPRTFLTVLGSIVICFGLLFYITCCCKNKTRKSKTE